MKDDTISRQAAVDTVERMYKACEGSLSDYHDLLVAAFMDLTPAHGDGDTISRKAALSALNGLTEIYLNNLPPTIDRADAVDAIKALPSATDTNVGGTDTISRKAAIADAKQLCEEELCDDCHIVSKLVEILENLPPAQPGQRNARVFQGIIVEYPSICAYPEYEGKPYFSIKYTENGQEFTGYGTYKPEVLSEYLKEYFMPPAQPRWIPCSERLPENSDFYLVTVEWWDGKRFTEDCSYDHKYKVWNDGEYDNYGAVVIAWMEKPEPWEGGQDETD